jgi:serine/threonine protein kinase
VDQAGREFAVKVMNGSSPDVIKEIEKEVKVLRSLNHPNILPFLGYSKQQPEYFNDWSLI